MADTIDQVSERLTRLEVTVATGCVESKQRDAELATRLTSLEQRVEQGFSGSQERDDALERKIGAVERKVDTLERRMDAGFQLAEERGMALSRKIDVNTEALRGDIRNVLDAVTSLADEMRRTTDSIREEHAADRKILMLTLEDHSKRISNLEQR